jgi:PilZ domain
MERRRSRRFSLTLPLAITRRGSEQVMQLGITKNLSSGGVMFTAQKEPEVGGSIEYVITLHELSEQSVRLRCAGKTLRYNRLRESAQPAFEIAATLERYEFVRSVPPARNDN